MTARRASARERAALVGLVTTSGRRQQAETSLEELAGLVAASGAEASLRVLQERPRPDPATFIGKGKLEEVARACAADAIDLVVFDNELTPTQLRQIESALDRKVLDRTQLILDIFAGRARTREGKWQVELAQLRYLLPRLIGAGLALSRLGGGIGTRGPGETKLETDRRRIRQRIDRLAESIESIRARRARLRDRRHKASVPTVALVGYTNAGKTTLFNLLAQASAEASDALFVTLDPLVRRVSLPDRREILVSDTVGFIDRLPHTLVAAFRATLEEVKEADLLLHVIDAASPDRSRNMDAVRSVVAEVGASHVPVLEVFNKIDLLGAADVSRLAGHYPEAVLLSARRGDGQAALIERLTSRLGLDLRRVTLRFDAGSPSGRTEIARVYRLGRVVRHETVDGRAEIDAEMSSRVASQFRQSAASRRSTRRAVKA